MSSDDKGQQMGQLTVQRAGDGSPQANLTPLRRNHALLDPARLSDMAEEAAHDLMAEGESSNTRASYRTAMRYWGAWYGLRYGHQLDLPVPVPVVVQFIVDHAERSTKAGLACQLPAHIDEALVEGGFKGKLGAPALNTLTHRVSVLSMAHHLANQPNPCIDPTVKALLSKTRKAYAKRNATPHKQRALTKEPLEAVLETCDDSLKGKRDRALLLFAWSSGGRRRSEVSEAAFENLRRADEGGYLYTLANSKTNHSGKVKPEDVKPVVGIAAEAMEDWLKASGITSGPLFRRISKAGRLGEDGLTGTAIRNIVKTRCSRAGVGEDFSAHSLRSGFVTEAGRQNMPLQETMAMTGHRSMDVVTGYFRAGAAQVSAVARMMDTKKVDG
ncbi:site-specific integrase [Variovorax sp. RA8]|uniref:site-specific integrase n=1 Tax=Variovorax sp. (strain JCM 16519 / RA8) TaxID=662548 RepID=UPI0013188A7A|nr:site-specific integrase [Variovorax sp. RA8]VTU44764.1 site-specific tyrosine recombinase XerC [Variovorax sp. RA8]